MRLRILILLFIVGGVAVAQANKTPAINWSDTTRDVYIDNEIDRGAQVVTADSPSRLALISAKLESAVVLNVPEHSVSAISKDAFQFAADRTRRITPAPGD